VKLDLIEEVLVMGVQDLVMGTALCRCGMFLGVLGLFV